MESEAEQPLLASDGASSELEEVLSDSQLPYFQRIRSAFWIEFQLLFLLAAPAVAVYMINNAMSMSTRIFSGQLGNLQLAAASLGNQGIQLCAYGLMVLLFINEMLVAYIYLSIMVKQFSTFKQGKQRTS